ncbi:MAG: hypothetical protein KY467_02910 [Gemmatimonadetes bacterium]|nr:hypothetical protein [Gemmatimonadota bacterium]
MFTPRCSGSGRIGALVWRPRMAAPRWLPALAAAALLSGCATMGGRSSVPCTSGAAPRIGVPAPQCSVRDFQFNGATREPAPYASFPQATSIRVVVTDANPFLYAYQIQAEDQRVNEASITEFFNFAFGISFPKAAGRAGVSGAAPPAAAADDAGVADDADDVCAVDAMESAFISRVERAAQQHGAIAADFALIQHISEAADDSLKVHSAVYLHPERLAPQVQAAALDAVRIHDHFATDVGDLRRELDVAIPAWTATVAALNADARHVADANACPEVTQAVKSAALLVADTAAFRSGLASVASKLDEAAAARQRLFTTAEDRGRFYYTTLLKRYDTPHDVTVTVRRKTLAPKDTFHHVASQRLNVGGRARFSFSAGLGWTSLGTTTYAVSRRFVTPVAGANDTVNAVVVAKENSDAQVFPMVTFNTRLTPSPWPANLHLVLGVGVSRADARPLPGYLVGLGLDGLGQRLVVTGGLFLGEEHRLGGGLRVGDRVPGSEQTVPMQRRMVGKLGVGLTYRIFSPL